MSHLYEFDHLLAAEGWLSPGYLTVDPAGTVSAVSARPPEDATAVERLAGFAVPGLANLHSHAFQRALAGRAESLSGDSPADSFWTWRRRMYDFVARLDPEDVEAIGAFLYHELVKQGFTAVGEFHYLHHDPQGSPYANRAEMGARLFAAAECAGIAIALLPVLYAHDGIGQPPNEGQRRFVHGAVDDFLALVAALRDDARDKAERSLGIALHSLRAVAPEEIRAALEGTFADDAGARVHIHVAEQPREVEEVLAGLGKRPVAWLLDEVGLDERWTLVHATHMTAEERRGLARSGAVAGLCPTTEAALGDGIFPLAAYQQEGGRWGIGTDGHFAVSVAEELRLLEWGQRLASGRRNVLAEPGSPATAHSGRRLFDLAAAGGARSLGIAGGVLAPGARADLVVLDGEHPLLLGHRPESVLDAWLLCSGARSPVAQVMVGGRWMVRDGVHVHAEAIESAYKKRMTRLLASL
jgi:formimidoylglutamate deiminase